MKQTETVLSSTGRTLLKHIILTLSLVATAVLVIVTSLIPPQILKTIIDSYLSESDTSKIIKIALIYFSSQLLVALFSFIKETLLAVIGQYVTNDLRKELLSKQTRLPSLYFSTTPSGTTAALFTGDVDAIQSLFTNGIVGLFIDACKIIGIVVSVWMFSVKFGVLLLVMLPIIYLLTRYFKNHMFAAQLKSRNILAIVANYIPESLKNSTMIKSFHAERFMEKRYDSLIDRTYKEQERINFYDSVFSPIIQILRAVTIAFIALFAAKNAPGIFASGAISVGMAAAAIQYVSNVFKPVESLSMEIQNIQSSFAGVKRVDSFFALDERPQVDTSIDLQTIISKPAIALTNVSFAYNSSSSKILDDVSLLISPGEHVTFEGRTGAGKTTLFKLILGELPCTTGAITIGQCESIRIPDCYKRSLFGYVEQSFRFIPGTVRDQLTLGDGTITDEAINNALDTAGLLTLVNALPDGLDTVCDKSLFSQGQLQLLSIARAIVTKPPILLLDEITANLDSNTERQIINALEKAGKGRTQLNISHRLSAVLSSDRIITIQNAKCVE